MTEICTGCGCTLSIEQLRKFFPDALACCPERKMVDAVALVFAAQAVLDEVDRNLQTKEWPIKYAAPWAALTQLRAVLQGRAT